MLPWATRRLVRAIRKNPIMALLIEGFLFFAMAMTLSTPSAWAGDIQEWKDVDSGVHTEQTFDDVAEDVARKQGTSVQDVKDKIDNNVNQVKENKTNQNTNQSNQGASGQSSNQQSGSSKGIGSRTAAGGGSALNSDMLNARTAIERVNLVVTGLLLPVGIVWASWQIVYIALVCGLLGIDPLDLITKDDEDKPWEAIKKRFSNFAIGLALVGGIWLIFELVLFVVANFVGALETNL